MHRLYQAPLPLLMSIILVAAPGIAAKDADRHALFTELLGDYVVAGKVNYRDLRDDKRLDHYLQQLSETDPETLRTRDDQLAFWINAYNAFTLKVICDNYPLRSINDLHFGGLYLGVILKKTVWDREYITIHGKIYSLNEIEHKIVRPVYEDPRAHFALVCASISCPPLRAEAFEGYKLNAQLDDQGRAFFSDPSKNRFEPEKRKAHISKILDWYSDDFGSSESEILRYITRFLPNSLSRAILVAPENWKVSYTRYDWGLNEFRP